MPNIEIIVREMGSADGGAAASQSSMAEAAGEPAPTKDTKKGKMSDAQKALLAGIINAGRQQAMNAVSQYGNLTGNYVVANNINIAIEIATDMAMVLKGGPVGVVAVLSKHTINAINAGISQANGVREQDFRNALLGRVATQGSRY